MEQTRHCSNIPYPSMDILFEILNAPVKFAVLKAAVELDMSHILATTSNVDAIGKRLGIRTSTGGLVLLLDAMVALGLAAKENKTYSNTGVGTHFLDRESPVFMGRFIENMEDMIHKNLAGIAQIVKNGPPEIDPSDTLQSESKWASFIAHLAIGQRAGIGDNYADLVQSLPEFKSVKKILDLGGGPGIIGARILGRLPEATGFLLDLPAVIKLAGKELAREGMADRISFIAGDYNEVDLGSGYDLIWASHNLYFVKDRISFFTRVKNALSPKGVFVCLHEGLTCEGTAPREIVLMRLSMALEGQDTSFAKGEIASCLEQAGFAKVESSLVNQPSGPAELVVARPFSTRAGNHEK